MLPPMRARLKALPFSSLLGGSSFRVLLFSFFFSCPHAPQNNCAGLKRTPVDAVVRWSDSLPRVLNVIFNILQNSALLWVLLILFTIYAILVTKMYRGQSEDVRVMKGWLTLERQEMAALKRQYRVSSSALQEHGRLHFRQFLQELHPPSVRESLAVKLKEASFDDLFQLVRGPACSALRTLDGLAVCALSCAAVCPQTKRRPSRTLLPSPLPPPQMRLNDEELRFLLYEFDANMPAGVVSSVLARINERRSQAINHQT